MNSIYNNSEETQNLSLDKKLNFVFCLVLVICSLSYSGIPFWFQDPIFNCYDIEHHIYFSCSQTLACNQLQKIKEDKLQADPNKIIQINNFEKSLTMEYKLICANRYKKAYCETLLIFAQFIAYLLFTLKYFNFQIQKRIIYGILIGIILIVTILGIVHNFIVAILGLFCMSCLMLIYYSNIFSFANALFSGNIKQIVLFQSLISILDSAFVCYIMKRLFIILSYYFQINLKLKIIINILYRFKLFINQLFVGIPSLILLILYNKFIQEKCKILLLEEQQPDKTKVTFCDLIKNAQVLKNFIIFCTCVLLFTLTYICATIGIFFIYLLIYCEAVDTIFGGIYLNMTIFGVLELIAGVFCLKFINSYPILTQLKISVLFCAFVYLTFIFQPTITTKVNFSIQIFYIVMNLFGKLSSEMGYAYLLALLDQLVALELQQMLFSSALCFSCFLSTFIPIYIEFMRANQISPLFSLGIFYIITFCLLHKLQFQNKSSKVENNLISKQAENCFGESSLELEKQKLFNK